MKIRNTVVALALFAICFTLLPSANAVSATNFTLDKSSYNPGDSGKAMISFTNDRGVLIQITSVTMTFNYYYQDGRVYTQAFTTTGLSMNVSSGAVSQPITVQFSLPSTIATGYITPSITVFFNTLNGGTFQGPDHDNSDAPTPLLIASTSTQTEMYAFIATTVLFGALAIYFAMRYWNLNSSTSRSRTNP
jgi:hypothetical protein